MSVADTNLSLNKKKYISFGGGGGEGEEERGEEE